MTPIPRSAFVRRPEPNVDSWLPPEYPRGAENDDGLDPIRSYPACHVGEKGCEPLLIPGWGFVPRAYWDAGRGRLVTEQERSDLPTAVVFHDSFAALWLAPLLAQHFRRVVFAWEEFDRDLVEAEHPDVVISETVERYMPGLVR
jgi:hypothetical protein